MLINYEHYRIFYFVAKYQNITRAASVLMSSQPNVTRTIKHMEQSLGCSLFTRTAGGVKLTAEGKMLYEHVSVAYEHIENGEKELLERLALHDGRVTIGTSETALHVFLLDRLREFHALYPRVKLKIANSTTPQSVKELKNGTVDFSVVPKPEEIPTQIKSITLCHFNEVLIGGSQYKYLADRTLSLRETKDFPFICLDRNTASYEYFTGVFAAEGMELMPDIEVGTSDMVLSVVKDNLGIGFVPEVFAEQGIREGSVFRLRLDRDIPKREICLMRDKGRSLSVAADRLQKFLING